METKIFNFKARWLLVPLVLMTLGVTNVWGAAATLPVNYSFDDGKNSLPTGVTGNGLGSDYAASNAPYRLKFDTQGDNITIEVDAAAAAVSFGIKNFGTPGSSGPKFKVQGSADGSSFSDIQQFTVTAAQNKTQSFTTTNTINSSYRYFRIYKSQHTCNVGLGTLAITKAAVTCTVAPTVGADLTSVSATVNSITATVPISAIGGCNITENGLVYSTSVTTPTVGAANCTKVTTTACGSTAANKTVEITGLTCGQSYYVRGYATNDAGTSYTNVTEQSTSACPKYTVTLKDDNTELTQATAGASVTLPNRTGCDGYTFAGWTKTWTEEQDEWTTTAPTIINAGSYTPEADENLYPVYTKTESGGTTDYSKTETFENQTTSTTYNSTQTYTTANSNAGIAWSMYYGTVSTNDVLTGSKSAQMRWYSSATSNIPNIKTTTAVSGLQTLTFNAAVGNANIKMKVEKSTDGSSWTTVASNVAMATTKTEYSYSISGTLGTGYYIRIGVDGTNSTAPSSGNYNFRVDDVKFDYQTGGGSTTSYISVPQCCSSPAVVTVNPTNAALALDIDGSASTSVSVSQSGGGSGRYYEPTITPAEGASTDWSGNYKTAAYNVTFTATATGTYTIVADFKETAAGCSKYGSADITVAANPILTPSSNSVAIAATCGAASTATDITMNSRYLAGSSITASIAKSSGSGTFTISSDGSTFNTSNKTISGGTSSKVTSHIYVRYEAVADEVGSATGTLTLTQGETVVNIPIEATVTCGCNIRFTSASDLVRITAANGIWVQANSELELSGSYLKTNADNANVSIRAYTNNGHFQLKTSGTTGEGAAHTSSANALTLATDEGSNTANGWTGYIGIVYKPAAHNTTESATLTVEVYRYGGSTVYTSTTYTLYGRSLPENFVIAVSDGSSHWFAVPADMVAPWGGSCSTGLGTYAPYPIEVDNTTTPTALSSNPPSRAVYTAAARTGNVNTNPQTLSFKSVTLAGSGNYYLYGSSTNVESDGSNTNIQNANFTASEKEKWFMDVVNWNNKEYNMHLASTLNTNVLAFTTAGGARNVGQYASNAATTKKSIYILPVTATCDYYLAPTNITCQGIDNTYYYFRFKPDRTSNYEVSLNGSSWSDLTTTIVNECTDEDHPTLLEGKVALATYRGQTVYIRVKSAGGCQSNTTFSVPNPSVEVNAGTWMNMTGMAGYAFANSANSVTISGLASCGDQVVGVTCDNNKISASVNQSTGVVTISMTAGDATAGVHTGTLEFTLTGGTTRTQNIQITLQSKAVQEWDGGDVTHFWNGMLCDEESLLGEPKVTLSYNLYYSGALLNNVGTFNSNSTLYLMDMNTGEKVTAHTMSRSFASAGVFQVSLINLTSNGDLTIGHKYRLVWENHSEDGTILDMITNSTGVPYQSCYMEFIYTQDCSSPTLLPGCTSGTTAYVSWGNTSASCSNYTLEWYQRTETNVVNYSIKDNTGSLQIWKYGNNIYECNNNYLDDWVVSDNSTTYKSATYGYQVGGTSVKNYIYTPRLNQLYASASTSTQYKVTVTLQNTGTANAYAAQCFVVDNTSCGDLITSGYSATFNGATTTYFVTPQCPTSSTITSTFTVSGLTATSRIGFTCQTQGQKLYVKNVEIKRMEEGAHSSATIAKTEDDYTITDLTSGKTYYAVLSCGSSTSNEISFTTSSGTPSFHFYSDSEYSNEITEAEIVSGTPKTIYFKGTSMASCENPTATITSCFSLSDELLVFNYSTKELTGHVTISNICAAADGELTINLGGHYPLPLHCGDRQIEVVQWAPHGVLVESYVLPAATPQMGSIVGVLNNGAYTIQNNNLDLTVHANELLKITWGSHIENFRVPIMITGSCNSSTLSTVDENSIIVVMAGQTLTINNSITCEGIEIYPTAKLQFSSGSLTAKYIRLYNNGDAWANFAKLDVSGASSITVDNVYADFRIDEDRFHYITLPFDIATGDVTYAAPTANGAYAPALRDASHTTAFYVRQYDGRARETNNLATENTYNVNMPHIGAKGGSYTMTAGRGYMIGIGDQMSATGHKKRTLRFPIAMNSTKWTAEKASSKVVGGAWVADGTDNGSARPTNKGWNLVGNPFMRELTVTSTSGGLATGYLDETGGNPIWEINDDGIRYITIYNAATDAFTYQPLNTSFTLKPMAAFYVQMKNAKYIHFQEALNGQASIPAILRAPLEEKEEEVNVIISLSNENQSDKAGIVLHSKYDVSYNEVDNADYPKLMSNTQVALWSIAGEEKLASNGLPKAASDNIPLGYQALQAGQYSFTLNVEESDMTWLKHVWLTDLDNGASRDLLLDSYEFSISDSEKRGDRFLLSVELYSEEEITTEIEGSGDSIESTKPVKFIYENKMYILHRGIIYDATGKRVNVINK